MLAYRCGQARVLWWGIAGNAKRLFFSRKPPFYMYKGKNVAAGGREHGSDHELKYYPPFPSPPFMRVFNPKWNQNT